MTRTFEALADLPIRIERYELEARRRVTPQFTRVTTTFHLHGDGQTGMGEDVSYSADDQEAQLAAGPVLPLAGDHTVRSFSEHLAGLDLHHGGEPAFPAYRAYRQWGLESAALDLGLRQAGSSLAEVLGRTPQPVRFVASVRFQGGIEPILERIEAYPGAEFKLDPEPGWTQDQIEGLARTGAVQVLDFKGLYRGTPVDVPTDPDLYRAAAAAFPDAWLEDPDLSVPEAEAALRPHRERITWDYPIHSVADVGSLPFPPRGLNCKPSRFGTVERLLDFYDFCEAEGISLYGGGQSELGIGRGQIQLLAALFHPDGPNDVAPAGWDQSDWPRTGLPTSPLDPAPDRIGFRRAL